MGIEEVGTETTAPRCVETFVEVNAFDSSSNVQMTKVFMTGPERKKSLKKLERISSQFDLGGDSGLEDRVAHAKGEKEALFQFCLFLKEGRWIYQYPFIT